MLNQSLSAWNTALNVLLYPSTWLHEQTHYVVLAPYAESVTRNYSADSHEQAGLEVTVEESCPRWRFVLGALAPTIIGVLCALAAALVSVSGLAPAQGSLVGWLVAGTYWFLYTLPSGADIGAAASAAGGDRV